MKVLAIYGASGLGREVLDLAETINTNTPTWGKFWFVDDNESLVETAGLKISTLEEIQKEFGKDDLEFVVALGEPALRSLIRTRLRSSGLKTVSLIHPNAQIGDRTIIGEGCVIQYGCFISCDVKLGDNVYTQPNSSVGHDSTIGQDSVVSSYSCVAGHCTLGNGVYVGMNTAVKEGSSIGSNTIVGMGSMVIRDIPENVIALGNPARPMKNNEEQCVFNRNTIKQEIK